MRVDLYEEATEWELSVNMDGAPAVGDQIVVELDPAATRWVHFRVTERKFYANAATGKERLFLFLALIDSRGDRE